MLMIKRLMTQYVPGMLSCQEIDSFLYDYCEGNLTARERFTFKLHISMCKECRHYLRNYRQTINKIKTVPLAIKPEEKVPEDLIRAILMSKNTGKK